MVHVFSRMHRKPMSRHKIHTHGCVCVCVCVRARREVAHLMCVWRGVAWRARVCVCVYVSVSKKVVRFKCGAVPPAPHRINSVMYLSGRARVGRQRDELRPMPSTDGCDGNGDAAGQRR